MIAIVLANSDAKRFEDALISVNGSRKKALFPTVTPTYEEKGNEMSVSLSQEYEITVALRILHSLGIPFEVIQDEE